MAEPSAIHKWDRLAETWAETSPPAVPSEEDLGYFRARLLAHLGEASDCAVLLGCTVGLRRLFMDEPALSTVELHCVDWSRKMYEKTTAAGGISNQIEIYHKEDWLEFDLGHRAKVILGDKSIDNIAFVDWPRLFTKLSSNLACGGILLLHVGLVTDQFRNISFRAALKKWSSLVDAGKVSPSSAAAGLWEDCLTGSAFIDEEGHVLTVRKYQPEIEDFKAMQYNSGSGSERKVFDSFVRDFGPSFDDEWTAFTLQDIEDVTRGIFSVEQVMHSSDYEAAPSQPIIELVKTADPTRVT